MKYLSIANSNKNGSDGPFLLEREGDGVWSDV